MSNALGLVEWFGVSGAGGRCNYCRSESKPDDCDYGKQQRKFRAGMWAHNLTAQNYENLMDRGWRRSGKYCYKPVMNRTCCPTYTIWCDTIGFRLTRSQKKVIKSVNAFLISGHRDSISKRANSAPSIAHEKPMAMAIAMDIEPIEQSVLPVRMDSSEKGQHSEPCMGHAGDVGGAIGGASDVPSVSVSGKSKGSRKFDEGQPRKARLMRIDKKLRKTMDKLKCDEQTARKDMDVKFQLKLERNKPKTLEQLLFPAMPKPAHKLEIRFVCTLDDEYKATDEIGHRTYQQYQMKVHGDDLPDVAHKQYKRFLIDSPLISHKFADRDTDKDIVNKYGSYHMQYWLDGDKLIAVGVVDILPSAMSSVYLYYDPEYSFLSLGTYSALREIEYVRRLATIRSELKFYYMGFYIHDVPKMRYKGRFQPSSLLCPETYTWQDIARCTPKLDKSKYSRLNDDLTAIDQDAHEIADTEINIYCSNKWLDYEMFKDVLGSTEEDEEVYEYSKLVGRRVTTAMLLFRKRSLNF